MEAGLFWGCNGGVRIVRGRAAAETKLWVGDVVGDLVRGGWGGGVLGAAVESWRWQWRWRGYEVAAVESMFYGGGRRRTGRCVWGTSGVFS